jgi:hypothetical protein
MTSDLDDTYRRAMQSLADDMAQLRFDGASITGKHGLVSANVKTRQLSFRRKARAEPFCVIEIPATGRADSSKAMSEALLHPALRGWNNPDGLDDMTSVLMGFIELVDLGKSIDFRKK